MYSSLLFYIFLFPFYLLDFLSLCHLFIYFYKSPLVIFSICLCFVHFMLGLRLVWWCFNNAWVNFVNFILDLWLAWDHKIYHKIKVFSPKVSFQIDDHSIPFFSRFTHSLLGLRLVWRCLSKLNKFCECHARSLTCLNSQSFSQNQNFSKNNNKIKSTQHISSFSTKNYLSMIFSLHLRICRSKDKHLVDLEKQKKKKKNKKKKK